MEFNSKIDVKFWEGKLSSLLLNINNFSELDLIFVMDKHDIYQKINNELVCYTHILNKNNFEETPSPHKIYRDSISNSLLIWNTDIESFVVISPNIDNTIKDTFIVDTHNNEIVLDYSLIRTYKINIEFDDLTIGFKKLQNDLTRVVYLLITQHDSNKFNINILNGTEDNLSNIIIQNSQIRLSGVYDDIIDSPNIDKTSLYTFLWNGEYFIYLNGES